MVWAAAGVALAGAPTGSAIAEEAAAAHRSGPGTTTVADWPGAALAKAKAVVALPGGGWLALESRALRLLDAAGAERARHAVRGDHLDSRSGPTGTLAVLLESDTQRTLRLRVDEAAGTLTAEPVLASPSYSVEAMCLFRDPQGLDHVFLLGDEGLGEQWLLRDDAPALQVRRVAVAPQPQACRADDAAALLLVQAEGSGLWAYRADAEGPPAWHAVAQKRPYGVANGGVSAFAVLPGGVAVIDGAGRRLHVLQRLGADHWRATASFPLHIRRGVETLAWRRVAPARIELRWRDESARAWQSRRLAWPHRADAGLPAPLPIVLPAAATAEMSGYYGDAADDPAIWVHPVDPARSRVIGTNKRGGLHVYGLDGRQHQFLPSGRVNNVDVRQGVQLGGQTLDIAVGTQRDDLSLVVYKIDADGQVSEWARVPTTLEGIYGTCLFQPRAGGLEVIVNDQDGTVERWRLEWRDGGIVGTRIQRFRLRSQPEGCVADDDAERLFIGEEDVAVWAMPLTPQPAAGDAPRLERVISVGGLVAADIEGLAIHAGAASRYLIVSSQGNNSYIVLDAAPPYQVRGAFRIGLNAARGIDGVSETDGLEATARALGPRYPQGVLVVQDGFKRLPDGPQNFKIVDWRDIAKALALP